MRPIYEACVLLGETISSADPNTRKLIADMHPTAQFLNSGSYAWTEKHGLDAFLHSLGAFGSSVEFLYRQLAAKRFSPGDSKIAESRAIAVNESAYAIFFLNHSANVETEKVGNVEHTSAPNRLVKRFVRFCKELVDHAVSEL